MKTPFTLEAWLKDKSQKVVDQDGRPVRIICTDADGLYPIIGLVDNKTPLPCGKDGRPPYIGGGGGILFLVTPEPELSEFEKELSRCLCDSNVRPEEEDYDKWAKEYAPALLALARKELSEQIVDNTKEAYENGKAEALRTRATELTKNLANSGMDKDSIPYHLIEFMCNLYTCRNWKEIEETAEAYATRIKAAAVKDLPRWRNSWDNLRPYKDISGLQYIVLNGKAMNVSDLTKLPGFKE